MSFTPIFSIALSSWLWMLPTKNNSLLWSKIAPDLTDYQLNDIIESWDFELNGKISQRKVKDNSTMAKGTIEKYWPAFKEHIKELNKTCDLIK